MQSSFSQLALVVNTGIGDPSDMASDVLALGSPRAQLRQGRLPRRFAQLYAGLVCYGVSMALLVRSGLGVMPWDVLHQGLTRQLGLTLGTWSIITGIVVLLLWWPLRQWPGVGTVSNVVVIGLSVDAALLVLPNAGWLPLQLVYLAGGVCLNGFATASYVGVGLGAGPRDGLMTGLTARTGWPLRAVRTGIEGTVLLTGWLLGGTVGVATLVYALAIGTLVQALLPWFTVCTAGPDTSADPTAG